MSKYFQLLHNNNYYFVHRCKSQKIVYFFTLQRWKQFTDKLQGQNRPETNHQEHNVDAAPEIKPVTTRDRKAKEIATMSYTCSIIINLLLLVKRRNSSFRSQPLPVAEILN